jgi:hypothetical protein
MLGLTRIDLVVAEIWGENFPHSVICAFFEAWENKTMNSIAWDSPMIL